MKIPIAEIEAAIKQFQAVEWTSSGYQIPCERGDPIDAGWVKFGLQQSPLGWRTLEFLAWLCSDMIRADERLRIFPTSPAPYLNTPGECLSFVIECYPLNGDQDARFRRVAEFIESCRKNYWPDSSKDLAGAVSPI